MNHTLRSSHFGAGQARDDVGRPGAGNAGRHIGTGVSAAEQARAEVAFDRFTRGRYATDASHYQIVPLGVAVPRTIEEAEQAIEVAKEYGVSVTARGGGTSQCGQTVNQTRLRSLAAPDRPARSRRR